MKQVKCINNHLWEKELTTGKTYTVSEVLGNHYGIVDNKGTLGYYLATRFNDVK